MLGEMLKARLGFALLNADGAREVVLGVAVGFSETVGWSLLVRVGPLEGIAVGKTDRLGEMLKAKLGFALVDSDVAAEVKLGVSAGRSKTVGWSLLVRVGLLEGIAVGKTYMLGEKLMVRLGFALLDAD